MSIRSDTRAHALCLLHAMMRCVCVAVLLGGVHWLCALTPALADETTGAEAGVDDALVADLGTLASRYESLNELEGSADTSEQVVVDTRIGVLTTVNRALDDATVSFSGEVVGEVLNAEDGYKWVNLLGSDGSCVGVYLSETDAGMIAHVGNYSTTGTTLQIKGVYHTSCSEHQGELDVHAAEVSVVDAGGTVSHAMDSDDVLCGLVLCCVAFVLIVVFFAARHFLDVRDADAQAEAEVTWQGRSKRRMRAKARKKQIQKRRRERRFWPRRRGDR